MYRRLVTLSRMLHDGVGHGTPFVLSTPLPRSSARLPKHGAVGLRAMHGRRRSRVLGVLLVEGFTLLLPEGPCEGLVGSVRLLQRRCRCRLRRQGLLKGLLFAGCLLKVILFLAGCLDLPDLLKLGIPLVGLARPILRAVSWDAVSWTL